jgi:hypothetical protein
MMSGDAPRSRKPPFRRAAGIATRNSVIVACAQQRDSEKCVGKRGRGGTIIRHCDARRYKGTRRNLLLSSSVSDCAHNGWDDRA